MGIVYLIGYVENMFYYIFLLVRWMCLVVMLRRKMYLKNLRVGVDIIVSRELIVLMRMDSIC